MKISLLIFIIVNLFYFNCYSADVEGYSLYLENDSRNIGGPGSDQAYSNGFKFSYIYAQDKIPNWSKKIINQSNYFDQKIKQAKVNFGLSIGHQIYTPRDTGATALIMDDRPYAGWLYLGFATSLKKDLVEHFLELDLGVIGPSALGKETQNNFHDLIGTDRAFGWHNGLNDELTIQLFYQSRFKFFKAENVDLISLYGGSLGNVQVATHLGTAIRIGINLPDNFGPSRPSASDGNSFISSTANLESKKSSYYFFSAARGNVVIKNVFLDGNHFRKSHHVQKNALTFESELGFGIQVKSWAVSWSFVTKSPEFIERKAFTSFASVNLIYLKSL